MKYRWVDNNSDVRIAAVDLETGVIEINRQNWNQFSPFEKKYILLHEEGHYKLQTDSEIQADLYAINRVAGIEPKSLKKSIDTLYKVGILDETRIYELYKNALKLDYKLGNQSALKEINNLENMKHRIEEEESVLKVKPERSHKTNGFVVGNMYFSFTNILLIGIFVVLIKNK